MRILFISPRQGWPALSGAKLREYHFLRALGDHGDVTYVFFREPGVDLPRRGDLPFCREIVPVTRPKAYSADRVIRGAIGRLPLPVLNYTSSEMMRTVEGLVRRQKFDAVHLDGIHLAAYAPLLRKLMPEVPLFFDWHNIESEGMRRYAELTSSPIKGAYARLTARRLAEVENQLLAGGYGNVVCSERERDQLAGVCPAARIAVIENGVDADYFRDLPPASNRHRILFVGLMAYHANIDAAVWFARQIWPGLRERLPGRTLTLAGANPAQAVLALRAEPGVEVTGTVPDLRPYYAEAFAAIAPLRTGAGTRLKILEAMAAGVPVVSTKLGAEGLDVTSGREILMADDPAEWEQSFTALGEGGCRCALIDAGHRLVSARYDWKIIREALYTTYMRWMGAAA